MAFDVSDPKTWFVVIVGGIVSLLSYLSKKKVDKWDNKIEEHDKALAQVATRAEITAIHQRLDTLKDDLHDNHREILNTLLRK